MKVNSIAAFWRELTIGRRIHTTHHRWMVMEWKDDVLVAKIRKKDMGIRTVSKVQSNSFACRTKKTDGTFTDSWLQKPKAKDVNNEEMNFRNNSNQVYKNKNYTESAGPLQFKSFVNKYMKPKI